MSKDEDKYRVIVESAKELILTFDGNGTISYINESGMEMIGYFQDELPDMNIADILPPDQIEKIKTGLSDSSSLKSPSVHELTFIDRNLEMLCMEAGVSSVPKPGNPSDILIIARPCSGKVHPAAIGSHPVSEPAEIRGDICRSIAESAKEMILSYDTEGKLTFVNPAGEDITGYLGDELMTMNISDILAPAALDTLKQRVTALSAENAVFDSELISRDMKLIPVVISASPIILHGKLHNILLIVRKTDGLKKNAEPLAAAVPKKAEEDKHCLIAGAIRDMVLLFDIVGKISYVNEKGTDLSGYSENELLHKNIADILPADQLQALKRRMLAKPVSRNRKLVMPEIQIVTKSGRPLTLEITASLIMKNDAPSDILILARDLTRHKRMEKEVMRAQKFEALATLAGGLVDSLNNSLTGIMGNIDLALMGSEPESRTCKLLSYSKEGCTDIKELIRQFVTLSKRGTLNREIASFGEFLKETVRPLLTESGITCDFLISEDLWPVSYDELQMRQAVRNLILNAAEAMPGGGTVEIRAENLTMPAERKKTTLLLMEDGDYVKLSVRDRGVGIHESDMGRIFDPYFSTKKMKTRKWRGLGLTTVYSVVRKHSGYIDVESKPGVETVFYLYLPASRDGIPKHKLRTKDEAEAAKGRILIMDDEEIVIDVVGQMLLQLGYEAAFSKNGKEAVESYKRAMSTGNPFDVVILDLHVKEGMGGKATIRELLKIDPGVKAIVSSGYSNDPEMTDFEKYGFSGVVEKPYTIQDLGELLESVYKSDRNFNMNWLNEDTETGRVRSEK